MPHQVLKASVKGSTGDLAKITKKLATVQPTPPATKINILSISAGEVTIPGTGGNPDEEYGVISLILDPDDGPTTDAVIAALTGLALNDPGQPARKVEHVYVYPLVHAELADVPGTLEAAATAIGDLNIMSVHSMGTIAGAAHVGFAFKQGDNTLAATRLTGAGIVVHPPS